MHCIIVVTTVLFLVIVNPFPYDSTESVSGFIDGTLIPRDISTPEDSVVDFNDAGESQPDSVDLQSTGTSVSGLQTNSISPDAQEEAMRPCETDGPDKVNENMMRRDPGTCASWPSVVPDPGRLNPPDPHHMPPVDVPPAKAWPLEEPSPSEGTDPKPHKMPDEEDPEHPLIILDDGDNKKCRGRKRTVCCWGPANLPEVVRCILYAASHVYSGICDDPLRYYCCDSLEGSILTRFRTDILKTGLGCEQLFGYLLTPPYSLNPVPNIIWPPNVLPFADPSNPVPNLNPDPNLNPIPNLIWPPNVHP